MFLRTYVSEIESEWFHSEILASLQREVFTNAPLQRNIV